MDLFVSGRDSVLRILPFREASLSVLQQQFSSDARGVISSAFTTPAAPAAARTDETLLRAILPKVASKLGAAVVAMNSEVSSFGLCASLLVGPRYAPTVTSQQAVLWSYEKVA